MQYGQHNTRQPPSHLNPRYSMEESWGRGQTARNWKSFNSNGSAHWHGAARHLTANTCWTLNLSLHAANCPKIGFLKRFLWGCQFYRSRDHSSVFMPEIYRNILQWHFMLDPSLKPNANCTPCPNFPSLHSLEKIYDTVDTSCLFL